MNSSYNYENIKSYIFKKKRKRYYNINSYLYSGNFVKIVTL